jgi:hypothetical protein
MGVGLTPDALLEHLGLSEYRLAFRSEGMVSLSDLQDLTDAHLVSMGITEEAHRGRILQAIASLGVDGSLGDSSEMEVTGPLDSAPLPGDGSRAPMEEDEDDGDEASLDQFDGTVSFQVEEDDITEVPFQDVMVADAGEEGSDPPAAVMGKLLVVLVVLVVLVLLAGVGGWFVVRKTLQAGEDPSDVFTQPSVPVEVVETVSSPPVPREPVEEPQLPTEIEESPVTPAPQEEIRPSFSCEKAGTRAELLICQSAELASLDREMNLVFGTSRGSLDRAAFEELREAQVQWLRSRDACVDEGCVARRYRERLAVLK